MRIRGRGSRCSAPRAFPGPSGRRGQRAGAWGTVVLVLLGLGAGATARGQDAAPPGPPAVGSPAAFEKPEIAKKAERLYKKITAAGFYPTIRGLAEGTGIGPGLTFWKPHPFGGPVGVLGTIGWNPRVFLVEARLGRVPSRPGKIPDRRFTLEALTTDPPEGSNYRWFVFFEARRLDVLDNRLYFAPEPGGASSPPSSTPTSGSWRIPRTPRRSTSTSRPTTPTWSPDTSSARGWRSRPASAT